MEIPRRQGMARWQRKLPKPLAWMAFVLIRRPVEACVHTYMSRHTCPHGRSAFAAQCDKMLRCAMHLLHLSIFQLRLIYGDACAYMCAPERMSRALALVRSNLVLALCPRHVPVVMVTSMTATVVVVISLVLLARLGKSTCTRLGDRRGGSSDTDRQISPSHRRADRGAACNHIAVGLEVCA